MHSHELATPAQRIHAAPAARPAGPPPLRPCCARPAGDRARTPRPSAAAAPPPPRPRAPAAPNGHNSTQFTTCVACKAQLGCAASRAAPAGRLHPELHALGLAAPGHYCELACSLWAASSLARSSSTVSSSTCRPQRGAVLARPERRAHGCSPRAPAAFSTLVRGTRGSHRPARSPAVQPKRSLDSLHRARLHGRLLPWTHAAPTAASCPGRMRPPRPLPALDACGPHGRFLPWTHAAPTAASCPGRMRPPRPPPALDACGPHGRFLPEHRPAYPQLEPRLRVGQARQLRAAHARGGLLHHQRLAQLRLALQQRLRKQRAVP
jgi:hypothetical protein